MCAWSSAFEGHSTYLNFEDETGTTSQVPHKPEGYKATHWLLIQETGRGHAQYVFKVPPQFFLLSLL